MTQLLKIGEFAALGGCSVKAVRYYESQGLICPGYTDPQTRYRYFRVDQYPRLALITNLRAAGFSIAEIAGLLHGEPDGAAVQRMIAGKRDSLLRERAAVDDKLAIVDSLLCAAAACRDDPLSAVKLTAVPAQRVHAVRARVPSLGELVTELFEAAESRVARVDGRADRAPFLIFHDPPVRNVDLDLEVCVPLMESAESRIENRLVAACARGCSVVYAGAYAQTRGLGETLLDWVAEAGLRVAGPLREIFHRFGAHQSDYRLPKAVLAARQEDYITELLVPVAMGAGMERDP